MSDPAAQRPRHGVKVAHDQLRLARVRPRFDGVARISAEVLSPLAFALVVLAAAFGLVGVTALTRPGSLPMIAGGVAVAGGIATLVWIGALLERAVTRPVRAVRRGLRELERGDYSGRLSLDGARELRELADEFNRLAAVAGHERERLTELATTDPLTGLANHRHFHERLAAEVRASRIGGLPFAVIAVDIDSFKRLNDAHGPPAGDQALKSIATALRHVVRDAHLVARLGSDDFMLLLSPARPEFALEVATRALSAVDACLADDAITASAGFACLPEDASDENDPAQLATLALEVAKHTGGNHARRYDAAEVATIPTIERQRAELDALLGGEQPIAAVLEPLIGLRTGRVLGYEALPRIETERRRPWCEWLEQARRCDRAIPLEAAAVRAAVDASHASTAGFISINLTPAAIISPRTLRLVPDRLDMLVIEVSEQELATADGDLAEGLAALRARGARVVVDGVGGGRRALDQIIRIQPQAIKLDPRLVAGAGLDATAATAIEFFMLVAERLGATAWADGVQTQLQQRALVELGIRYGQMAEAAEPAPGPDAAPAPPPEGNLAPGQRPSKAA